MLMPLLRMDMVATPEANGLQVKRTQEKDSEQVGNDHLESVNSNTTNRSPRAEIESDHSKLLNLGENFREKHPKLEELLKWLKKFIREEEIMIDNEEDEKIGLSPIWQICVVPDRLKKPDHGGEDCFTPQAFSVGLHNIVSCFDASKVHIKFEIARVFSEYIFDSQQCEGSAGISQRWKRLVTKIVGDLAIDHEQERHLCKDVYKDFGAWDLKLEATSSGRESQIIKYWHFALFLAVDAVFLVTSLQAFMSRSEYCEYSTGIRKLIEDRTFEISEFLKWDLSLVENQVPLKLLEKVISLQMTKNPNRKLEKELELLIKHAVWLSYPFLANILEPDDCCLDFKDCWCPCLHGCHDCILDDCSDIELGRNSDAQLQDWRSGDFFDDFGRNWDKNYSNEFRPKKYDHLLHCTHVVISGLLPLPEKNPTSPNLELPVTVISKASFTVTNFWRRFSNLFLSWKWKWGRRKEGPGRNQNERPMIKWNEDRIPSATQLRDAGVQIRGRGTSLAPSFDTFNFWSILTELCCFVTCLSCCYSSTTRWRASLELPRVKMYTETKRLLRNLAVYEQLAHGGCDGHMRNYIKTMRCLVHREEDVVLLIRSGVIQCQLAGPKDVVQTWGQIDNGLDVVPLEGPWVRIYSTLNDHLKNRWKIWYAKFWISNCSNPLVACSFVIFNFLFLFSAIGTYLNISKSISEGSLW